MVSVAASVPVSGEGCVLGIAMATPSMQKRFPGTSSLIGVTLTDPKPKRRRKLFHILRLAAECAV